MIKNKKRVLLLAFIILTIIYLILVALTTKNGASPLADFSNIFGPTKVVEPPIDNNPIKKGTTTPPVKYDKIAMNKIINKMENRIKLNPQDQVVENRLVGVANRKPLDLSVTNNYTIVYIEVMDNFMVEINNQDLSKAKAEATSWFISQGFSQQAICDKPVIFFINWDIAQQLRPLNITFSPIAEGC